MYVGSLTKILKVPYRISHSHGLHAQVHAATLSLIYAISYNDATLIGTLSKSNYMTD